MQRGHNFLETRGTAHKRCYKCFQSRKNSHSVFTEKELLTEVQWQFFSCCELKGLLQIYTQRTRYYPGATREESTDLVMWVNSWHLAGNFAKFLSMNIFCSDIIISPFHWQRIVKFKFMYFSVRNCLVWDRLLRVFGIYLFSTFLSLGEFKIWLHDVH